MDIEEGELLQEPLFSAPMAPLALSGCDRTGLQEKKLISPVVKSHSSLEKRLHLS